MKKKKPVDQVLADAHKMADAKRQQGWNRERFADELEKWLDRQTGPEHYLIAENVLHLPPADAGLQHSIVRLHNSRIGKKGTAGKFYRRQAVVVANPNTKTRIIRNVMGSHPLHPITSPKSIMLDYDAKVELEWNETHLVNIYPASAWQVYLWYWQHPDTGYRIATRLAVWGLLSGMVGILLGIVLSLLG